MHEKQRRRLNRKAKKRKYGRLKGIAIPGEINVYDKARAGMLHPGVETEDRLICMAMIAAIDNTLDHFGIPVDKRSQVGDVVMRFAMMMAEQDRGIQIPTDDPQWRGVHALADMYEHYNRQFAGTDDVTDQNTD